MKTSFAIATFLLEVGRTAAAPAFSSLPLECERLFSCLTEITKLPVMDDIFGAVGLESASTDDICHDIVLLFGGETGVNAICGAADAMTHTGSTMTREKGQLQATCLSGTSTDPDYPSGGGYEVLTDPLLSLYLFGGREERSDANAYSQLFIGTITARAVQAATSVCDSDILIVVTGGACLIVAAAAEAAVVATEATVESLNIQDGLIDAAEIQAAYLNTNTIISQNCGIEGSIDNVYRKVVEVENDVEDFRLEAVGRFNIVDHAVEDFRQEAVGRFNSVDDAVEDFRFEAVGRFNIVDHAVEDFRLEAVGRFNSVDDAVEDFRFEAVERFDTVDDSIANLQADFDLDSLKISIEPTDRSATTFLVLSAERGVETEIDLVIDCFDEADEIYRAQPFTRTEISEGTTLVKFPKSAKSSKEKGGCNKIHRFKGTAKKVSRSGIRSTRTVIRRK
jgi:hypothetical protein